MLLKQTLEAPFDPGPLLLSGENVRLTTSEQLLTRVRASQSVSRLSIGIETTDGLETRVDFEFDAARVLRPVEQYAKGPRGAPHRLRIKSRSRGRAAGRWLCFLGLVGKRTEQGLLSPYIERWVRLALGMIHVPGLRGNPARSYPAGAVGAAFPGTLDKYVARSCGTGSRRTHRSSAK